VVAGGDGSGDHELLVEHAFPMVGVKKDAGKDVCVRWPRSRIRGSKNWRGQNQRLPNARTKVARSHLWNRVQEKRPRFASAKNETILVIKDGSNRYGDQVIDSRPAYRNFKRSLDREPTKHRGSEGIQIGKY